MKTTLTIQESAELIKRGVKRNKASGTYVGRWEHSSEGSFPDPESVEPLFTLTDLLSLLPKKIIFGNRTNCRLKIQPIISSKDCISEVWQACYLHTSLKANAEAIELIDALHKLLLWAIDHNHVKLD